MTGPVRKLALLFAVTAAGGALQNDADTLDRELDRGAGLARAHQYRAGLAAATELAGSFPTSSPAHQMLGFFQMKCQENVAAVRSYRRALELDPDSPDITVGLAVAQSAAGMEEDARRTLEVGVKRFPKAPAILEALGVVLLKLAETGGGSPSAAAQMFEGALKLDGSLSEAHYQLGNLALREGDLGTALDHLRAAALRNPGDSRVHFVLARVYRRMGRTAEEARETDLFQRFKEAELKR